MRAACHPPCPEWARDVIKILCRIRSYLDSVAGPGVTALDAVRAAIEENPWLSPFPAIS